MNTATILALGVALGTGIALGIQATANSWIGTVIGPLNTGLVVIAGGGLVSAVILATRSGLLAEMGWSALQQVQFGIILAGLLAVAAIAGTAYALPRTSVAAGLSAIILGQMIVAVIVDTMGWGGAQHIPLSAGRIAGLGLLAVATWLLVPQMA